MIDKLYNKYGLEAMREVWIEELLELVTKLQQSKRDQYRGPDFEDKIRAEIADVMFVIDQMAWYYGNDECQEWKKTKMKRTAERLL